MHNYADVYQEQFVPYVVEDQERLNYLQTFSGGQGTAQFWFGTVNYNEADPAKQLDFANGPLSQFMETNYQSFQCPNFGASQMDAVRFGRPATGFGYNGHYLSRPAGIEWLPPTYAAQFSPQPLCRRFRDVRETGRTVVFADSAAVKLVGFSPVTFSFEENWLLDPPSQNFPDSPFSPPGFCQCRIPGRSCRKCLVCNPRRCSRQQFPFSGTGAAYGKETPRFRFGGEPAGSPETR